LQAADVRWIDLFAGALVVVVEGGRVLAANRGADALLKRSHLVSMELDHLRIAGNGGQTRLDAAVGSVLGDESASFDLRFRNVEEDESVVVSVRRLSGAPAALVHLSDGLVDVDPRRRRRMQEMWNLSDVEAGVATAVVQGADLATYAKERGVSRNTVRTQLNSVFAKCGARRQVDLARVVLSGPAYMAESSRARE
jgi:DNA-binding CsgD family transcriptional regulator